MKMIDPDRKPRTFKNPYPYDDDGVDTLLKYLKYAAHCAERALTPSARLGRVVASAVRQAEHIAFQAISAHTERQAKHIAECEHCKQERRRVCALWAQLNTWLIEHNNTPTKRSMSDEDFKRQASDRLGQKLKKNVQELLSRRELEAEAEAAAEAVIESKASYTDEDYFKSFFSHCR